MTVTAEVLRELHRIHRQLSDLRDRHQRGPKQLRASEASVKKMEADLEELPQMIQLGREFIFKTLPVLLLYCRGEIAGSSTGKVDIDRWVEVISAEVKRHS